MGGGVIALSTAHAQQITTSYPQLIAAFALETSGNPRGAMQAAQSLIDSHALTAADQASALDLEGICYGDLDQPEQEIRVLEQAEHLLDTPDSKRTSAILNNMGHMEGQHAIAQHLYKRAFRLSEAAGEHGDMARVANNLASEALRAGKNKQARKYLERADREAKLVMDTDKGDSNRDAMSRDDLASIASMEGWLARNEGDVRTMLQKYRQALELWREEHGERHPRTAWGMLLVGQGEAATGDVEAGERTMHAGLALIAAMQGSKSETYAAGELAYARLLVKAGNAAQAAPLLEDAQTKMTAFTSQRCQDCTVSVMALH
jgi:tetratricopeptide (TPR) repeat protein